MFETTLARIVNRSDVRARVLIGLREDGLSRLNERFAIRIPDLLGNTLQVQRLSLPAARNAISKPLEVFSATAEAHSQTFSIENALVEEILDQVQEGRAVTSDSAGKGTRSSDAKAQVETAYLQLVLTKLWQEERAKSSTLLRLETFRALGGANAIVRNHVRSVMESLGSDNLREIAARLFVYLVTPSRTKIAQRTEDLVTFGEAPEAEVKQVLNTLADQQQTRILRRLSNPEQYEIFHDVLAQHILDWRRDREEKKKLDEQAQHQKEEAERKQRELEQAQQLAREQELRASAEKRAARRLRYLLWILIVSALMAIGAAYGFVEKLKADRAAIAASAALAKSSQQEAKANLEELQAQEARRRNDQVAAQRYQQQADESRKKADDAIKQAQQQGNAALSVAQQLNQVTAERNNLKAQMDSQQQELKQAKTDRDQLSDQVKTLRQELDVLRTNQGNPQARPQKPGQSSPQKAIPQAAQQNATFDPKAVTAQWSFATGQQFAQQPAANQDASCIVVRVFNGTDYPVTVEKIYVEISQNNKSKAAVTKFYQRNQEDNGSNQSVIAPKGTESRIYCQSGISQFSAVPKGSKTASRFLADLSGPNGAFTVNMTGPPSKQ